MCAVNYDPAGNPTRQNNNGFVLSNAFNNLNQNTTSLWSGALTVLGLANDTDGEIEVNGVSAPLRAADGHVIFVATNLPVVTGTNTYTAIHTDPMGRTATSAVSAVARNRGYGYDANGNMTNDGQFVYVWDDADRLKEVRKDGEVVMTCLYDGLGRRRERVMNGETNRYVYHDWAVLEVHDGDDNVLETYTHGPDLSGTLGGAGGIGGILHVAPLSGGAGGGYFHYDANGNVVRLTDANCEIVSSLEYGPFGTVLLQSGSYTPRYQFSSKEFDSTVGLNYYGYRFYSPTLGRWLSRDPIGEMGGINLYGFVHNAPIISIDLLGTNPNDLPPIDPIARVPYPPDSGQYSCVKSWNIGAPYDVECCEDAHVSNFTQAHDQRWHSTIPGVNGPPRQIVFIISCHYGLWQRCLSQTQAQLVAELTAEGRGWYYADEVPPPFR
ncbi:MAG: RHS repeat-associated core domain-containing protein [Kiritimatiellae bacterium]|nr:RHS repeat-associated core domain-containing protein [Kiritimatiellia bacterium]